MKFNYLWLILLPFYAAGQNGILKGTLLDQNKNPVSQVHISVDNALYSTLSDSTGKFAIRNIPVGSHQLKISYVGYQSIEQTILIGSKPLDIRIELKEAVSNLNEVQVQAKKASIVQEARPIAIRSVEVKDVISQNTLVTEIADRMSGVRIRRSGSLGDKSDISINGLRGSAIRVYLDGLPMEFIYPNLDISTLPLGNIKRIDVYKGVLPVDVGTDAMGGGIDIISDKKSHNTLRASYLGGSFKTRMADFNLGLANKNNYFLNVSGAFNSSANDYKMKAFVFEKNRIETIRRFNDAYQMSMGSVSFGVHSKSWADELRFSINASDGYKQLQNGARITNLAFGEVLYKARNYASNVKYEKSFLDEKLRFNTILNYSYEKLNYRDTTQNIYSWSGTIIGRDDKGEFAYAFNDNFTRGLINRSTIKYQPFSNHTFTISNLYAKQRRTGENFLKDDSGLSDYLKTPQYLTKNITGVQYEGRLGDTFTFSAAGKYYYYNLEGIENRTFLPIYIKDNFLGYNVGIKYDISENLSTKASYERGYLIPNFDQFVGNGANILRNTDLKPESSDNVNLSVSYRKRFSEDLAFSANLNGFVREQYDVIFVGNTVFTRYENSDQVGSLGAEGDFSIEFQKNWQLKTNYTLLRKRFTKIKNQYNQYLEGTTFPNTPTSFGNVELEWKKTAFFVTEDTFRAYLFYNHIGTFNHILIGQQDNPNNRPDLFVPTQNRLDAGASYRFPQFHTLLAFNIVNVFNAELFDNFSVPRAGRNFNLKIIYEINHF